MVVINTGFKQVAAFVGSNVSLECIIDGMGETHVACWLLGENVLTWGDEVVEDNTDEPSFKIRHATQLQVFRNAAHYTYTLNITVAENHDGKTCTMKVYELRANGTLGVVAHKDIASLEVTFTMMDVLPVPMPVNVNVRRSVLLGSEAKLETRVEGANESHVISWCLNGTVITRGKEVVEDCRKQRLVPKVDRYGVHTLTITDAQKIDAGTYSVKVYDKGSEMQDIRVRDIFHMKILC